MEMHIRLLVIAFLTASVFALHITAPQRYVVFIPATEGPTKVRPANLPSPIPQVVSLIEAEQRELKTRPLARRNPWEKPLPYKDYGLTLETSDQQDCLFGNCDLELDLILARHFVVSLFRG